MQLLIFIKQILYYIYLIVILNSLALYENYTITFKFVSFLQPCQCNIQVYKLF